MLKKNNDLKNSMNKALFYCASYFLFIQVTGCNDKAKQATQTKTIQDTLQAFIVTAQPVTKTITLPAELVPFEKAELFAKIQGYVKNIKVDIGDHVKSGQVLAVLQASEYNANLLQSVSSAQSAKAKYQTSKDYYDRLVNASKEPGAIAEGELIKAKNQMLSDNATYNAAKQASGAYSQINNYLIVKAPFGGVVTQRNADPGDLVGAGNSKPLLIVENNNTLRLRVSVPETYTAAAVNTANIIFSVDAIPEKSFSATLDRKSNTIDPGNRTELWEFLVKNKTNELRSGMYANVKFPLSRNAASVVVPYGAIATTLEKKFVIKYQFGETKWIDVRNGINMDSTVEIFGDIKLGDTLLKKGTDEIRNGTKVAVRIK
jgi:membrane fusion protein, multidrug efflux system